MVLWMGARAGWPERVPLPPDARRGRQAGPKHMLTLRHCTRLPVPR